MVHEKVTLYGLPIVADRLVGYRRVDPEHARELFIRHALVEGEWPAPTPSSRQNRALLEELEELEHRFRRHDLVVDLDTLERLYDERVPPEVVSGRHFDALVARRPAATSPTCSPSRPTTCSPTAPTSSTTTPSRPSGTRAA